MHILRQSGIEKVLAGETTIVQMIAVDPNFSPSNVLIYDEKPPSGPLSDCIFHNPQIDSVLTVDQP